MPAVVHIDESPSALTPVPTKNTRCKRLRTKKNSLMGLKTISEIDDDESLSNEETVDMTPKMADILSSDNDDEDEDSDMDIDLEHAQSQRQRNKNKNKADAENTKQESNQASDNTDSIKKVAKKRSRRRIRKKVKSKDEGQNDKKQQKKQKRKANRVILNDDDDVSEIDDDAKGKQIKKSSKKTNKKRKRGLCFDVIEPPKKRLKKGKNVLIEVGGEEYDGWVHDIKGGKVLIRWKGDGDSKKPNEKWMKKSSKKLRLMQRR